MSDDAMQSLVIGASGIVGGYIARELVRAGETPLALSRTPRETSDRIRWIVGDLTAAGALRLPPVAAIYCTAHVGLLADAMSALAHGGLRRVVAFTSTSIVTKQTSEVAAERDSVRAWAEAEQRLIAACDRLGVAWTILRPTIIYDEGRDQNITRLAGLIRRFGFFPLAGDGSGLRQPVHAQDLARGALDASRSAIAAGQMYAVPGGETLSYREMVGRIFDGLHKRRRIVPVPMAIWKAAFLLVSPLIGNANVAMGSRMGKDMIFDASPARQDFGWAPRGFRPVFARSPI